ncbi:2-polyprenyl-6-methoxyphenol hydroxylase-like FAD-dependent oxidoreductase [Actinomycetospora succinea]|uniref:2-polyprenyl-6-methoxyphenol hydroxylase-like FAD-dependent oxidoreductase n=1 Tax=Actinomycetospora succinea TaxID=663603 RepID=A0A4R6VJN2_9PSEU|nr:FAD-dependent monooxygenase [Actinomycetospora succinea]TDQ58729.1 2-polyprenyl-6-methoxyphenol hydroxylase-like FAD-dependent oxidoreductase [Actinomycetospora succinea]
MLPERTQVLVAGGGPVGLATAVELGRRGVECVVVEPRTEVSHSRPRCKTVNVRTMEHLRRWGIADRLRERAPLPVAWSQDVVFCTSLSGHELSRFTGVLGLAPEPGRCAEPGQQAPQYVLEELLREVVGELAPCTLATGHRVVGLAQDDDAVRVEVADGAGECRTITAAYVVGCDGPRSVVRDQIGADYEGEHALRPNFGMVVRAPGLWSHVRHGPAVQYWTVNPAAPSLMGPLDRDGTWWVIAFGVEREAGHARAREIVDAVAGVPVASEVLSTDPWTARMQLVDRARDRRVFLAGDAAHLNPPFGGHGLNTGVGDAVDLGWKLAAVLRGWGGPELLASYEAERRPVQERVVRAAEDNMRTLSTDLLDDDLDRDDAAGSAARDAAHRRIQETKAAEFHALDLVLDVVHDRSPVIAAGAGDRLPHAWVAPGHSRYDDLGPELTLLGPGGAATEAFTAAARTRGVDLRILEAPGPELLLVRPDQHVAWRGDAATADADAVVARACGGRAYRPSVSAGEHP